MDDYHPTIRILLLGSSNVGKRSLIGQLHNKDDLLVTIEQVVVRVKFVTDLSLLLPDACLFVFDLSLPETLESLEEVYDVLVRYYKQPHPFILVGNKADLSRVSNIPVSRWCAQRNHVHYIETSTIHKTGLEELFNKITFLAFNYQRNHDDDLSRPISQKLNIFLRKQPESILRNLSSPLGYTDNTRLSKQVVIHALVRDIKRLGMESLVKCLSPDTLKDVAGTFENQTNTDDMLVRRLLYAAKILGIPNFFRSVPDPLFSRVTSEFLRMKHPGLQTLRKMTNEAILRGIETFLNLQDDETLRQTADNIGVVPETDRKSIGQNYVRLILDRILKDNFSDNNSEDRILETVPTTEKGVRQEGRTRREEVPKKIIIGARQGDADLWGVDLSGVYPPEKQLTQGRPVEYEPLEPGLLWNKNDYLDNTTMEIWDPEKEKSGKDKEMAEKDAKEMAEMEAMLQKENQAKAEMEAKLREAKERAEREAKLKAMEKAEREAKMKAEKEAKLIAEKKAKEKAEREAILKAEKEAMEKAEREAKLKAEKEAMEKADREAKLKAKEAKENAEREAKLKADNEAKEKAEKEAREIAQREARERAERAATMRAEREKAEREKEAKEKSEREAMEKKEKEAKEAEKVARERAEKEARERAEKEAKEKSEKEAKAKAEKEARERAEIEAKEKAEREKEAREKVEREAREKVERMEREARERVERERERVERETRERVERERERVERETRERVERETRERVERERERVERETRERVERERERVERERERVEREAREKVEKETKEKAEKEIREKEAKEKEIKEKEIQEKREKEEKNEREKNERGKKRSNDSNDNYNYSKLNKKVTENSDDEEEKISTSKVILVSSSDESDSEKKPSTKPGSRKRPSEDSSIHAPKIKKPKTGSKSPLLDDSPSPSKKRKRTNGVEKNDDSDSSSKKSKASRGRVSVKTTTTTTSKTTASNSTTRSSKLNYKDIKVGVTRDELQNAIVKDLIRYLNANKIKPTSRLKADVVKRTWALLEEQKAAAALKKIPDESSESSQTSSEETDGEEDESSATNLSNEKTKEDNTKNEDNNHDKDDEDSITPSKTRKSIHIKNSPFKIERSNFTPITTPNYKYTVGDPIAKFSNPSLRKIVIKDSPIRSYSELPSYDFKKNNDSLEKVTKTVREVLEGKRRPSYRQPNS